MAKRQVINLPDECWELIFKKLDDKCHLKPLSLVCKEFLAITNRLLLSLKISYRAVPGFPKLLQRFRHVKVIDFKYCFMEVGDLVYQIAQSGLNLEELNLQDQRKFPIKAIRELGLNMKSLKILKCTGFLVWLDTDLFEIASSLPWLEILDISCPKIRCGITDAGIEELSRKLKELRKISLYGIHGISHKSLIALSKNCLLLRKIEVSNINFRYEYGLGFVMRHSLNLTHLSIGCYSYTSSESASFTIENSIAYARALRSLEFQYWAEVSDILFYSIAEAGIQLKKLVLSNCNNFTVHGLSLLLESCQSLKILSLCSIEFLNDQFISDISKHLSNLKSIHLNCLELTNSTIYILAKNCPSLVDIHMKHTRLGKETLDVDLVENHQLQYLDLAFNMFLEDESLKNLVLICPNLQWLNVFGCPRLTQVGMKEILKCCSKLHFSDDQMGYVDTWDRLRTEKKTKLVSRTLEVANN